MIQQTFSPEYLEKLAKEAKNKGITIQALIRNIVADYYIQKNHN